MHTQHRLPDVSDVGAEGITVNRLSMMRALDTRYPISIRNESTGGSGRTSSRFPIRCLRVALMNPRNSTPLPAYDACYTIECGFHCATDCLPPIQITIVPSLCASTFRRDEIQCFASKTLRSSCNFSNLQFICVSTFNIHYWHYSRAKVFHDAFFSRALDEFELDHFETRLILETDFFQKWEKQ